ncbi:flagellar export chaperone FliS [Campylobacter troglodytis]|uniref:flagellar export chaperone FliS n=1 Tax=Campylobacter troglodytis TaxID=654363 RepID=UPI00115AEBFA|nr:flagellar export chaperone FliS [Campylobacter troglodytis]TQR60549.1 flagella export chaperone FliS [Campylobacter troglodytis]
MQDTQVYNAYSENQIVGIQSPQRLVEMLYEGLLRFCGRIKICIRKNDIEQRLYYTKRATDIFIELINSLDYDKGGDVAHYLSGLYLQEIKLLSQANLKNDELKIDEVINVVRCLLEAWREIHPDLNEKANSMDKNENLG